MADELPGSDPETREIARTLRGAGAYIGSLPTEERRVAERAAEGMPIWRIAQELRVSDGAVARVVDSVLAAVTGRVIRPVETGGLGADTDPGVSGGYDVEGFDSIDSQPELLTEEVESDREEPR